MCPRISLAFYKQYLIWKGEKETKDRLSSDSAFVWHLNHLRLSIFWHIIILRNKIMCIVLVTCYFILFFEVCIFEYLLFPVIACCQILISSTFWHYFCLGKRQKVWFLRLISNTFLKVFEIYNSVFEFSLSSFRWYILNELY